MPERIGDPEELPTPTETQTMDPSVTQRKPEPAKPQKADWRLLISAFALLISLGSLGLSGWVFFIQRGDIREAARGKEERSRYLSYRVGLDLGLHRELGRHIGDPSLGSRALYGRRLTMTTASVRAEALGLGLDMQSSADSTSIDDLILQVKMLVRDFCGEGAHTAYVLGLNLGQATGILWPWSAGGETLATGAASSSLGGIVPEDAFEALSNHVGPINEQLGKLGFQQRIELDDGLSESSHKRLNELDRSLTDAWSPEECRWRQ